MSIRQTSFHREWYLVPLGPLAPMWVTLPRVTHPIPTSLWLRMCGDQEIPSSPWLATWVDRVGALIQEIPQTGGADAGSWKGGHGLDGEESKELRAGHCLNLLQICSGS